MAINRSDMSCNIVIIDDEKTSLEMLKKYSSELGDCKASVFQDSIEALNWCIDNEPDLVVVDYLMPQMDGLEFIRAFRATPGRYDIPLLMVTGTTDKDITFKALEYGATDFLSKPVDKNEFVARAKNMLLQRYSNKRLYSKAFVLADEIRTATKEIREREHEMVFRLSRAAEFRDQETGAHILRMAHYSRHIAENLGLSIYEQDIVLEAAPMHDIGKIAVPDKILLKPGKLTEEEFEIMKRHSKLGFEILAESQSNIIQVGAEIALTHHERFDGSGYPNGLSRDEIPLYGRIVAVADVFDALTSERPYKEAWSVERALEYLNREKNGHFDPGCVKAFLTDFDKVEAIRHQFQD